MAESLTIKRRAALSGWPMLIGWVAMLIFAFHASTHMVGAGDTWVAMACGRHFINHGVDTVEPFSANSHKPGPTPEEISKWPGWAQWITDKVGIETVKYWHPTGWINQNWLTHVIFYWLAKMSPFADADTLSFNTLVYWKFAIYAIAVICVYYIGRILGVNPALSAVSACCAMFVGRSLLDVRPAGFSNLLVAVFLLILVLATYRNILYIWLIVPAAIFWCNVHGGYIYLFIMLMPFVRLHLSSCLSKKWIVIFNVASYLFFIILLGVMYDKETSTLFRKLFVLLVFLTVLDFVHIFFRKNFVSIGLKGIYHTVAAGLVAFIAVVIFNPFHLTNLTHTFIISVSRQAKKWREVNEWHPGFEWSNPVGTGFPFLILVILSIGVILLWFFSRLLKPRLLKATRSGLEAQEKLFKTLSTILGCAAAVFISWVTFISLSFCEADLADFLICALFVGILLLSIYKSVHFIYLTICLILLSVWTADVDAGYHGRYIYAFIILPMYAALHIVASLLSEKVKVKPRNIVFVTAAAAAALILMTVIINPFKFEPVWDFTKFIGLRRIWQPVYERHLDISYKHLFSVLYILNAASIIIFLAIPYLRRLFQESPDGPVRQPEPAAYQLPRLDLPLTIITALTIYMAYRSRRFIPIAAVAACPVVVMFTEQIIRTISAVRNFYKRNSLAVSPMPCNLQRLFIVVAAIVVSSFGIWCGCKFKYVYLDAWPVDSRLNSVFMRMTASHAKPFYAGRFIKDNKLKGKMFNYWTEGGFIAWAQEPDPNTGRTPLQLFMDGRAQAAYAPHAYEIWQGLMSGGPVVEEAVVRGRQLTSADYMKIGRMLGEQLRKYDVWVVLMLMTDEQIAKGPFVRGLERNPDWPVVFFNNKQKLFVDITTPQGKELFDGIFNGKTLYPDDFSKNLILAHNMLLFGTDETMKKRGLEYAIKAFELEPSAAPIERILYTARYAGLKPIVDDFCKNYFDAFEKNKHLWIKQNGYHNRAAAATYAASYLRAVAKKQGDMNLVQFYDDKIGRINNEVNQLNASKRW